MRRVVLAASLAAAMSLTVPPRPLNAAAGQTGPAYIDPNALADALMGFFGADISDDTNLTDDSSGDQEAGLDRLRGAMDEALGGADRHAQDEDVVPINGDSSGPPPDEVMEDDGPALRLVSFPSPPRTTAGAVARPVAVYAGFHEGVIQMRVFSPARLSPAEWRRIATSRGVLAPLGDAAKQRVLQWVRDVASPGSGVHVTTIGLRGYCVEPAKVVPGPDAIFTVASAAAQEQFMPMRTVRRAAEFAAVRGFLRPQGDPAAYGRFVAQYAIWTKLDHWDQARFTDEFVNRTRMVLARQRRQWTKETEQTLRALAPARWRDIELVIGAAERVDANRRTAAHSGGQVSGGAR